MMSLSQLVSYELWFASSPLTDFGGKILLGGTSLVFILGLVLLFLSTREGKYDSFALRLFSKLSGLFLTVAVLWYGFLFTLWQRVAIFDMRIWFLLVGLGGLVWAWNIWQFWKLVPSRRGAISSRAEYEKYLPK
ncbi:MAG: hypothetical protein G01um101418_725 [Parcubacteria group bacterium Gr01-1014_18]|nr:MAG: hypothetical protein Greene041636_715 [Parcubacteria group bacterium Greene0416_36]TSC80217.1 MAG: hypothetical protein G01um101418_725 [Parcubacteria group bacterium Gr01-1014_18]TSC98399.1 MAG: hypothetical protein Greene101420_752 [Parcubacteria group bacterium Greene1014_20]TSD06940.1 MAG: hypothetical protein Greene07142_503 [Parcubacteria group bacterium Greene0714_2]